MSVKTLQVGRDYPSNGKVLNIFNHPHQCNAYILLNGCRQENCFEWKSWTRSCSMDRKERERNLIWLVNWMWRDSSVIPGGQQEMPKTAFSWRFSNTFESFLYIDILSLIFLNISLYKKWNRLFWKMEFLKGRTLLYGFSFKTIQSPLHCWFHGNSFKGFSFVFSAPWLAKVESSQKWNGMWFSDIVSRHTCSTVAETIGVTKYTENFGTKKCSENSVWSCWDDAQSVEPTIQSNMRIS